MASGTDATANGTAVHSNNEIVSHQESCLWPNALQVIFGLYFFPPTFFLCFLFELFFPFSNNKNKRVFLYICWKQDIRHVLKMHTSVFCAKTAILSGGIRPLYLNAGI